MHKSPVSEWASDEDILDIVTNLVLGVWISPSSEFPQQMVALGNWPDQDTSWYN